MIFKILMLGRSVKLQWCQVKLISLYHTDPTIFHLFLAGWKGNWWISRICLMCWWCLKIRDLQNSQKNGWFFSFDTCPMFPTWRRPSERERERENHECWLVSTQFQICIHYWVVVSNIFYVHPYLGKWSNLTNIFQMGWNHQLDYLRMLKVS